MKYQVDNAIIMAAGLSSRFAPISYEKPKALIEVKGEILIERQIKQLHEAGINNIIIVVGYKKRLFEYLIDKYNVILVENPQYLQRNNHYSLYVARKYLKNTYICSADNYFNINPFEKEVDDSYYSAVYVSGKTNEWCLTYDNNEYITDVQVGGSDAWVMLGHAFFSKEFSNTFTKILESVVDSPDTNNKLWEAIYSEHIGVLHMKIRQYDVTQIYEFDSLDELRAFDSHYTENSGSNILQAITKKLKCKESKIVNIVPISRTDGKTIGMTFLYDGYIYYYYYETGILERRVIKMDNDKIQKLVNTLFPNQKIQNITRLNGLTNHTYKVTLDNQEYVFRIPGDGTKELIDRKAEKNLNSLACDLQIDTPLLYFDEDGVKVTHYILNAVTMDESKLREKENITLVADIFNRLHTCGVNTNVIFDVFTMAQEYENFIINHGGSMYDDYEEVKEKIRQIRKVSSINTASYVPCHNDPLCENWVKSNDRLYLIDWEYGGMNDPLWDLADVSIEANYTEIEDNLLLASYYQNDITKEQQNRFLANKIYIDFLWSLWGKTRATFIEGMDEYALSRYNRMKENIKKWEK